MSGEPKPTCVQMVYGNAWGGSRCQRPAGHGPGGRFCHAHDPSREAERRAKMRERWEAKDREDRMRRVSRGLREATMEELRAEIAKREAEAVRP